MKRWSMVGTALALSVLLLLIGGDAPARVRGQTPPNTPSAGAPGSAPGGAPKATPALESVRQQFSTFFTNLKDVTDQARQSPNARTRAALAVGPANNDAVFAQVQQTLANATPDQLAALRNILVGVPNLPKLPDELRSSLATLASGNATPRAGNLDINTNGSTYSTFEDTTNGTAPLASDTCESHFSGLLVDPNAEHRFDARAVWIGSWVTQQVVSALQVAYNISASLNSQVIDLLDIAGVEFNPFAAGFGLALGIANAINLGLLQELQEILDCVTNSYAENLYTENLAAKTYSQLALEADVTKGRAAAIASSLAGGSCTPQEELPASVQIGTGSDSGQLEDVKWFVTNLLTQMNSAKMAVGLAANFRAQGDQQYNAGLWKQSCQSYAQAFVEMSKAGQVPIKPGRGAGSHSP